MAELAGLLTAIGIVLWALAFGAFVWWLHRMAPAISAHLMRHPPEGPATGKLLSLFRRFVK